jgi:hypothetical protein
VNFNATLLIPIAQIVFGFFLLFMFWRLYSSTRNMDSWELTQGIITKSNIKRAGAAFSPDVEYQYSVLGVEYKGLSVTITLKQTYDMKVAQSWISEYSVGKKVNVFYNPEIHRMAVLEKGFSVKGSLVLIGSSLFLILSGAVFLFALLQ